MAVRIKNKAKAALICGLASCACVLLSLVTGYVSGVLAVLLGVCGIFLAITGFIYSFIAGKESGMRKSGFVAAGTIPSTLGLLFSVVATIGWLSYIL